MRPSVLPFLRSFMLIITGWVCSRRQSCLWWGKTAAAIFCVLIASATVTAQQTVFYVDEGAGGSNNGDSWANAYQDLNDVYADADFGEPGDVVYVAQGIYRPDTSAGFTIPDGVGIYGGFPTGGAPFFDQDPLKNPTTLSAAALDNSTAVHVIRAVDTFDEDTALDSFIITGGIANGGGAHGTMGGGLLVRATDGDPGDRNLKVTRCQFIDNSANSSGGGAALVWDEEVTGINMYVTFINCEFHGNATGGNGGAVSVERGYAEFINCLFYDNEAATHGGAIYVAKGCSDNADECKGEQCILFQDPEVRLQSCTLTDNRATSTNSRGGGVYIKIHGNLEVRGSILRENDTTTYTGDSVEEEQIGKQDDCAQATVTYSCIEELDAFAGNNNIDDDPEFANTTTRNYRLAYGSPAVDAGAYADFPLDLLDFNTTAISANSLPISTVSSELQTT